jgi:hypothetical protein
MEDTADLKMRKPFFLEQNPIKKTNLPAKVNCRGESEKPYKQEQF